MSSLSEIENRGSALEDGLSERQALISEAEAEKKALGCDLENCDAKISECENAEKGAEMLINSARSKRRHFRRNTKAHPRRGRNAAPRKILSDMERSLDGFNNTVKTVMREAEKGSHFRHKGPVSRLVSVDEKYSVAVETALGGALQNIVTEREADAKRAISFLKQNRMGRATFLPLDNIKGRKLSAPGIDSCPGFLGAADSLVSFAPEYREIFSLSSRRHRRCGGS